MKLTKKLEAEVLKFYHDYWDAYLAGDIKSFSTALDDAVTIVGTSISEIFHNKKQTIKFYNDMVDQMTDSTRLRNRKVSVKPVGNTVTIQEQTDLYVLLKKKWAFYGHVRITSILIPTKKSWKLIHQHASLPDSRTEEGEQLAAKQIAAENIKLREAVERHTVELRETNRELEIETALEKVRAIAMGMKEAADMLDICKTISHELNKLGVKAIRNIQTAIIYKKKKKYLNYEFYAKHNKLLITEADYSNHSMSKAFAKKMLDGPNSFFRKSLKGKKVQEWYAFQKTTNQFADKYLAKATSLNYYWYSLGPVALGVSTYEPLKKEEETLFIRFRNVFELSYRRYLDIEKAGAQAREAQIELTLERVRARTMAMQNSDELREVVATLYEQLQTLDFKYGACTITIMDKVSGDMDWWMAGFGKEKYPESYHVKYFNHPCYIAKLSNWKNGEEFVAIELSGKEKKAYDKVFFTQTDFKNLPEESIAIMTQIESTIFSMAYMKYGALTWGPGRISEEYAVILQRFAKVFEQTYTRFLDLKKAEAQVREAKIEAALERVRNRSLAMQSSKELNAVIGKIFVESINLDMQLNAGVIIIYDEKTNDSSWWMTKQEDPELSIRFRIQDNNYPFSRAMLQAWNNKEAVWNYKLAGKEKEWDHFIYSETDFALLPEHIIDIMTAAEYVNTSASFNQYGCLMLTSPEPFLQEQTAIIRRFSKVFEQTYTRFNDLKQAEAQTREAQIELGLERVRARAMAMQKSDELADVAELLFRQVNDLGIKTWTTGFNVWSDDNNFYTDYITSPQGGFVTPYTIDSRSLPVGIKLSNAKKDGQEFYINYEEGEALAETYRMLLKFGEKQFTSFLESGFEFPKSQYEHFVFGSKVSLMFITYEAVPEAHDIFKRFGKVFEQTYTRFLDLQTAEAQAREAQVQLALERVRARTMAMQRSVELREIVATIHEQLQNLGFTYGACSIVIMEEVSGDMIWWIYGFGKDYPESYYIPFFDHPFHLAQLSNWKEGKKYVALEVSGEEKKSYDKIIFSQTEFVRIPSEAQNVMKAFEKIIFSNAYMKHGALSWSVEAIDDEHAKILQRFATVFEQTYTRFLDLQKAEAQSREAQIELGLEKVRARAMAMQKSEELSVLIATVYSELVKLEVVFNRCFIMIFDKTGGATWWMASHEAPEIQKGFYVKYHEHTPHLAYLEGWKNRQEKWEYIFEGDVKKSWDDFLFSKTELASLPDFVIEGMRAVYKVNLSASFNNFGCLTTGSIEPLTNEAFDILLRFAKVFDLTYTRFNDLQKAEAQSREAQIELGLERVRARAMAMQKSEELSMLIATVYSELVKLEVVFNRCVIMIFDKTGGATWWMASHEAPEIQKGFYVKYHEHTPHLAYLEGWKNRQEKWEYVFEGDMKKNWDDFLFNETELASLPGFVIEGMKAVYRATLSASFNNFGCLTTGSFEPLTNEAFDILLRFAKVFDLTYTRFNDLQKAEAQSREAQIELGLERVRARAMAMQKSSELAELVHTVFIELTKLHFSLYRCIIMIYDPETNDSTWWMSNSVEASLPIGSFVQYHEHPPYLAFINAWKARTVKWEYVLEGSIKKEWDAFAFSETGLSRLPGFVIDGMKSYESVFLNGSFNNFGSLTLATLEPLPDEHFDILLRFAKVFDLTYTRFNDLQKAEAQAREAKIETALEKIRSRSLAMHRSVEIKDVVSILFEKLKELGLGFDGGAAIHLFAEGSRNATIWVASPDLPEPSCVNLPYDEAAFENNPIISDVWNAKITGKHIYNKSYSFEEKNRYFEYVFKYNDFITIPTNSREFILQAESYTASFIAEKNSLLGANSWSRQLFSDDNFDVLKRIARVFEQAYIRFLDLQKAEAQARETKIENALEKVRSRTMAMQRSNELADVALSLFQQIKELDITAWAAGFNIWQADNAAYIDWITGPTGDFLEPYTVHLTSHPTFIAVREAKQRGDDFFVSFLEGEQIVETYQLLNSFADKGQFQKILDSGMQFPTRQFNHFVFGAQVSLMFITYEPCPEAHDIYKRFGKVFEQTYTRFLDLQKAEAQAREAQIQLALERVRARTMAMQKSDELKDVAHELRVQLAALGTSELETCAINLYEEYEDSLEAWAAVRPPDSPKDIVEFHFQLPKKGILIIEDMIGAYASGTEEFLFELSGDKGTQWMNKMAEFVPGMFAVAAATPDFKKTGSVHAWFSCHYFSGGSLIMITMTPPLEESRLLMKRCAQVFGLAYRRFADLKKAEAQTREATIEASLERVRAKAMAMHKSNDLTMAVTTVFEELDKLNLGMLRCGIGILNKEMRSADVWTTAKSDEGIIVQVSGNESMDIHPLLHGAFETWLKGEDFSYELNGDDVSRYYRSMHATNYSLPGNVQPDATSNDESRQYYFKAHFQDGGLFAFRETPFPNEAISVMKRFAAVFNLTYKRFLDLQKAEAQAREAQIEAALERVRSVAMSMMKSEDLMTICKSVFTQLQVLGFNALRAAQIYIRNDDEKKFLNYDYSDDTGADTVEVNYDSHPYTTRIYDVIRNAGDGLIHNTIAKKELDEWKSYLYDTLGQPPEKSLEIADELHYYLYSFGIGAFGICTFKTINKEELEILKRFRNVFNLSYQRYSDIALAEAQAREAQIEAALERVRSRTLAMQKSDELPETGAELFRQLIGLNIAPNRLYIGIINNDEGEIEFWVTDEDGTKVSTMFSGNAYKNVSVKKMYDGWKTEKKSLIIDIQGEELAEYFHYLGDELHVPFKAGLSRKRRIQYISYFSKGFIGMASPDEQPAETILLLERFAYVFNLTFTRFNDLKLAEAHALQAQEDLIKLQTEKKRAEEALTELRATQTQLIQSEKMASLGQLTAGIAHEIQNPLNFVNNFSEVSEELIKEMMEEVDKGNIAEVKSIAADLVQNLGKIYHHGKRADSIVKGMLEHSRTSAGNVQLTDINALADEYLRLSYHGIRAKDKLFNTTLHTDFDNSIGSINIVGQDIARVLLNLYNNAFYAVNEKTKQNIAGYEPTVSVSTKKIGDKIEIKVGDNGNGIPPHIIDKIFQPFFTTKPTGQGTGLGLSLSYDIIKAHGGEISVGSSGKVVSKENEGTEFVVTLPA